MRTTLVLATSCTLGILALVFYATSPLLARALVGIAVGMAYVRGCEDGSAR